MNFNPRRLLNAAALSAAVLLALGHVAQADDAAVPQTITSPLGKPMTLKWDDEFNAVPDYKDGTPYLDRTKWQTTFWQGTGARCLFGNGEAQYYMDKYYGGRGKVPMGQRPDPFNVQTPGILTIEATKVPQSMWENYYMGEQRPFCSGMICSDTHCDIKYGYIEGRFKLPSNRGAWPAFWLLGDNTNLQTQDEQHEWPPEVDIFEFFGHRPTKFTTGYIPRKPEKVKVDKWMHDVGFDITKDFHTWGLEWDENNMVWTFDGKIVAHGVMSPCFRVPMYIIVNLAVGGNWYCQEMKSAGTPYKQWEVDETTMPWKMECDYVRVYQAAPGTPPSAPQATPKDASTDGGYHGQNR